MPRPILIAAAIAASAALSACAQTAEEPRTAAPGLSTDRQCFFARQINGYSEAPDGPSGANRLYVRTGASDRWLLETYGPCPDLDWSFRVAIDTRFAGSSLCTEDTATVLVPRGISGPPDRCTARVLGRVAER